MNVFEVIEEAEEKIKNMLGEPVQAKELGLDPRAGYRLWVSDGCIIVEESATGSLNYYGGFEYISKENVYKIGRFVIYAVDDNDNDDRVQECLDRYDSIQQEK